MNRTFRKTALLVSAFSLLGLCYSPNAYAADAPQEVQQAKKITGTVVDAMGPVIGASVVVKGTTNGVATDFDGNFSLDASPGQTLVISYIGYLSKEIRVTASQNKYNVTLEEDKQMLEEVVVIAYGQQKKVTITGAVSAVGGDELLKAPVASVANALQGKLPGMSVVQPSGMPGADEPVIRVRGTGSLNSAEPLVLVDGVERSFGQLDPNEIQDISILKDASATAVFGVRGANGVYIRKKTPLRESRNGVKKRND